MRSGLYIELPIRTEMETLWEFTQDPAIHQRWDLRFSTIRYLPKDSEDSPQKFLYKTRIGFGMTIAGGGESTGTRSSATGERTSALRFWSGDAKSLITTGAGYWKYIPRGDSIRFLTWYDYQTRFGVVGRVADLVFRPMMGWATAWSFDRLRLWSEDGIVPEVVLRSSIMYGLCKGLVSFVWIWHGLVPKLLFRDTGELRMLADAGISAHWLPAIGSAEILFGLLGLFAWRWRGYFMSSGLAMAAALLTVALRSPGQLTAAFNPVTLNLSVLGLSLCGWFAHSSTAFASRCLRRPRTLEKE